MNYCEEEDDNKMALRIRLRRMGRRKAPHYRIVVTESSIPRDDGFVAKVGHYDPATTPVTLVVDRDKALAWIAKGAMPSETVQSLLKQAGVFSSAPVTNSRSAVTAKGAAQTAARTVSDAATAASSVVASVASGAVDMVRRAVDALGPSAMAENQSSELASESRDESWSVRVSSYEQAVAIADYLRARRGFSTDQDLADVLGVQAEQLIAWKRGAELPGLSSAQLLSHVAVVVNEVGEFLDPDVIHDWFLTEQFTLNGRTPMDALRAGQLAEVLQSANATEHGAFV